LGKKRISESTIRRMSMYYRALSLLEKENYETVSSKELSKREKLTPAQVRKDLSFFGSFGTRGLGYPVIELKRQIASILGIDRVWPVALIGIGNIGSALVSYKELSCSTTISVRLAPTTRELLSPIFVIWNRTSKILGSRWLSLPYLPPWPSI
jgi:NADH/NAD ratio-sensing transcriptional regulator Rex